MRLAFLLSLVAPAVAVACAVDRAPDDRFDDDTVARLDAALVATRNDLVVPGIIAGIWVPGAGAWWGVAGTSDVTTGEPMTRDKTVRIGTITKTFTTTILLRLVDLGVVQLDDPVANWVPEAPNAAAITLRELGNLTAGLASYTADPSFRAGILADPGQFVQPKALLDLGFAETTNGCTTEPSSCFAPGSAFFDSDTDTLLLAIALERATNQSYVDLLSDLVVQPLRLSKTFQPSGTLLPEPFVHGVTSQGSVAGELRDATNWNPAPVYGVGDIVSTFDDLRVWAHALGTGALLSDATRTARFASAAVTPLTREHDYGLGVAVNQGWRGHVSELPGYSTLVLYRPDVDATIVVAANRDASVGNGVAVSPAATMAAKMIAIVSAEAAVGTFDATATP